MYFIFERIRSQAAALAKELGCKGSYPLMELPAHDRLSQTLPDMMHTLKDSVEKVYSTITSKDGDKVQTAEAKVGRFQTGSQKHASKRRRGASGEVCSNIPVYRLSSAEVCLANIRAQSVVSPSDFSPGAIFTKCSSLKSHDWKEVKLL